MSGDDRIIVSVETASRLLARQFPHWAHLPVSPVSRSGWDNHTFHIGNAMKMRLPSAERYVAQVEKEHRILPLLAPQLSLPIPVPLAIGQPDEDFPWPWSVYNWLGGETLSSETVPDQAQLARDLADFLTSLQDAKGPGIPAAGADNFHRGGDLAIYDAETRASIEQLGSRIDAAAAHSLWSRALTSRLDRPAVVIHGDIAVGNLLARDGRLNAVIDFGQCAMGDPACDLVIAWVFLDDAARSVFRRTRQLDDETWARARGWALWKALLIAANGSQPHPAERDPLKVIQLVIAEHLDQPQSGSD